MNHHAAAPVPGAAVPALELIRPEPEDILVLCGVPAANVTLHVMTGRLRRIEGPGVQSVVFGYLPPSPVHGAFHIVGAEQVGIGGEHQIVPVPHPEHVRALTGPVEPCGKIHRLPVLPGFQIL